MSDAAAAVRIAIAAGVGGASVGAAIAGPVGAVGGAMIGSVGSLVFISGVFAVAAVSETVDKVRKK